MTLPPMQSIGIRPRAGLAGRAPWYIARTPGEQKLYIRGSRLGSLLGSLGSIKVSVRVL